MNKFTTISTKDYTPLSYKDEYFHNKYELIQSFISEKIGEDFSDILAGEKVGKVTATLTWRTKDDLDIIAIQPSGRQISCYRSEGVSLLNDPYTDSRLDIDRNAKDTELTPRPIENIYWYKPDEGHYRLIVRLYERRTTGSVPINFTY